MTLILGSRKIQSHLAMHNVRITTSQDSGIPHSYNVVIFWQLVVEYHTVQQLQLLQTTQQYRYKHYMYIFVLLEEQPCPFIINMYCIVQMLWGKIDKWLWFINSSCMTEYGWVSLLNFAVPNCRVVNIFFYQSLLLYGALLVQLCT